MSQLGEATATTSIPEENKDEIEKKKLKIRFSLFFDGTLNNRNNISERERHETSTEDKKDVYISEGDGGANSYDNGRTNIAIMEPHLLNKTDKKEETGYDYVFKIYIEGQGTFNTGDTNRGMLDGKVGDSLKGFAMGSGDSGVDSRARKGISEALTSLTQYLDEKSPDTYLIEKIEVDVFGFSRGAATARRSIFLMLDQQWTDTIPLDVKIRLLGYQEITPKEVEVICAGVYDTVVSVNGSQYSYWSENKLNQRAIALATKSLHLAAAEEHRQDFPLHKINSAISAGRGKQYYLPGVHSDVGGSYNQANDLLAEKNESETTITKIVLEAGDYKKMLEKCAALKEGGLNAVVEPTEFAGKGRGGEGATTGAATKGKLVELRTIVGSEKMRTNSEVDRVINTGRWPNLIKDKEWLIAQGWYKEKEIKAHVSVWSNEENDRWGSLVVNRRDIRSAYSCIPLKLMAEFAVESGIKIEKKLEKNAENILKNETELHALEAAIRKHISEKGNNSSPNDWINDRSEEMKFIRNRHMHFSAKEALGYYARFSQDKRERYYYDA
jgi:hypothetical protein